MPSAAMADLYARRLGGAITTNTGTDDLHFHLGEAPTVGSPDAASLAFYQSLGPDFERLAGEAGLIGIVGRPDAYNNPTEPCTLFNPRTGVGVQWVTSLAHLPPWDAGSPFRLLIHWATAQRGMRMMHASSLVSGHRAMLFVGAGGSGKSGTTLAGISSGLQTVGDDYVVVTADPVPRVHRVHQLLKQDPAGIQRVLGPRELEKPLALNWQGKVEIDPELHFRGCMAESAVVVALVLPRIARADQTTFEPLRPQDLFHHAAASMWQQLPGAQKSGFVFATALTRRVPTWRMNLSNDPSEISRAVRQFLDNGAP
ncbi:hypothetical protein [Hyphomicrobium facile]|nr:hypothetical protein [Hyphomicrobium facile]